MYSEEGRLPICQKRKYAGVFLPELGIPARLQKRATDCGNPQC